MKKREGLFAKRPGARGGRGRPGHVAARGWPGPWRRCGPGGLGGPPIHGGPGRGAGAAWTRSRGPAVRGAGVAVHGGPRPWRGEQAGGRSAAAGRDGGAMAAAGEVAGTALRGETEHAEGTIGVGTTRRGRGAAHLREPGSAERSATVASFGGGANSARAAAVRASV